MSVKQELLLRPSGHKYSISSNFIMGCSSLAGLYTSVTEDTANETVIAAVKSGVLLFDTAPHYGCGLAEDRLGKALREMSSPNQSDDIKVWTKVGRLMKSVDDVHELSMTLDGLVIDSGNVPGSADCIFPDASRNVIPVFDYSGSGVIQSYSDSMKRMKLKTIHGLRIHDCESDSSIAAVLATALCDGGLAALVKMRADGLISEVSLGVNDASAALKILTSCPLGSLDSIMIAGSWNLLDHSQSCLDLLLECQKQNIVVHNAAIFASGLLVGGATYKYCPADKVHFDKVARWTALCDEFEVPLGAVAMKFALLPEVIQAVAVGVKCPSELAQSLDWFRTPVPPAIFVEAKKRGLIEDHVTLC